MTPLAEQIRREVEHQGPISFQRFMQLALYHPEYGYYRRPRDPFGKTGDFFTNSQVQPVFGRLLAQQIASWRIQMGSPAGFTVVEMGAGRGETLAEIQHCLPDATCVGVDVSAGEIPDQIVGVVYANEFFDALPVHVVERRGGGLIEHLVDVEGEEFRWVEAEISDARLSGYINNYAPGIDEGQKVEVNLAALEELGRIANSLDHGYMLTIDYGYLADEIAAGRRFAGGSLMAYARHWAFEDVLADPGNHDITAHVNFTALQGHGEHLGLLSSGCQTQQQFLLAVGQPDEFQAVFAGAGESEARQMRMQLKALLFGMGETFRVLVQRK